jgi:hypothetical protein
MNCIEQRNEPDRVWSTDPQYDVCRHQTVVSTSFARRRLSTADAPIPLLHIQMKMICMSFIGPRSKDRAKMLQAVSCALCKSRISGLRHA